MFDKNYYEGKKKKLEQKFAVNKDKLLGKITGLLNEFWQEQRDIQDNFKEIEEIVKNSEPKKEEVKKAVKEVKKNAKKRNKN